MRDHDHDGCSSISEIQFSQPYVNACASSYLFFLHGRYERLCSVLRKAQGWVVGWVNEQAEAAAALRQTCWLEGHLTRRRLDSR